MKKHHLVATARKVGKTALCALLVAAMVIPANLADYSASSVASDEVEAEAADADLPEPIMTLDFEEGFAGEEEENGFSPLRYEGILMYTEVTSTDSDGNYTYSLDYDTPFIEAGDYKYGTDGNQPTTYYDSTFGNVLSFNSSLVHEKYVKVTSDELDDMYAVGDTLQEEIRTYSGATITNPYVGMDLDDSGITIAYWVKAGVQDQTEEQENEGIIKNDSILFTFQNDSDDTVYQVDDLMKYEACLAYEACVTGGASSYTGEYSSYVYYPSDFDLGTFEVVTDDSGAEYNVYTDYGKLIRFNPSYIGTSTVKAYFVSTRSNCDVTATVNGESVYLKEIGYNLYPTFHTLDIDEGSMIKRGSISGSLTIAASNSFAFKEDDYTTASQLDADGNVITGTTVAIQGAIQENPNATDSYNDYIQLRHYNCLYWAGDGTVCAENSEGETEWHYVVCVIENDWVSFYVDGELYDGETADWYYSAATMTGFSSQCASKYFNKGTGLRGVFALQSDNVSDWSSDGTANASPANSVARSMLNWIADEDTVLMIGGQGSANEAYGTGENDGLESGLDGQDIGQTDGTLLDDITFYDVALTEDEAIALYDSVKDEKGATKDLTLLAEFNFDDDEVGAMPEGMQAAASNGSGLDPYVVNEESFGHSLYVLGGTASSTSATELLTNPFADQDDLTGVTISFWYKTVANSRGSVANTITLSFMDEPKILEHEKIQSTQAETETRTVLFAQTSLDARYEAGYDTKVSESLKNYFICSTRIGNSSTAATTATSEWQTRTNTFTEWQFVTMVVTNAGITMYYNGEQLDNNLMDDYNLPAYYGPRFYDGYYQRIYDSYAAFRLSSNNFGAGSIMSFLMQDDTTASIGLMYTYQANTSFQTTSEGLYDDICHYSGAATAEQVAALYASAASDADGKSAVSGEDTFTLGDSSSDDTDPSESPDPDTPDNPDKDITVEVGGTQNADGSYTFSDSTTGVTVVAPAGAFDDPDNVTMVVEILGTSTSADSYTTADTVLSTLGVSYTDRILYNIYFTYNGSVITPNAECTVSISPYTGYTASKCTVVYIDGQTLISSEVSNGLITFTTQNFGLFSLSQVTDSTAVSGSTASGGTSATSSGSTAASKTGDAANALLPIMLLAAAATALYMTRKKRIMQ